MVLFRHLSLDAILVSSLNDNTLCVMPCTIELELPSNSFSESLSMTNVFASLSFLSCFGDIICSFFFSSFSSLAKDELLML